MPRELDEVLRDLRYGLKQLRRSRDGYDIAESYYLGDDPELFISDPLKLYLRESVDAFRLNLASVAVDSVIDRLYVASFTSKDPATQAAIEKIVKDNDIWIWLNDAMREAETLGDQYMAVFLDRDGSPVIANLDPRTTRVIYDDDLQRIPLYMIRSWEEGDDEDEVERVTIYYPDEIWKFVGDGNGSSEFSLYEDDGPSVLVNTLNDLPVGHLRNGFPYGRPGHERSYGMQQLITKSVLNMVANIDFMGFRQRYALKDPSKMETATIPDLTTRTKDGEVLPASAQYTRPQLTAGPGKLWSIVAESVGEFTPTDVEQFVRLLDWAIISMAQAERLPVRLFADKHNNVQSGASQRENDKSLRDRVNARKRSYGGALTKMMQKAVALLGIPDADIDIEWSRDEIITDAATLQAAETALRLVTQAIQNESLRPFVEQKLREFGYEDADIQDFFSKSALNSGQFQDADLDEIPNPPIAVDPVTGQGIISVAPTTSTGTNVVPKS